MRCSPRVNAGALVTAVNGAGRTTSYSSPSPSGLLGAVTDARGQTTRVEWVSQDQAWRVTRVISPDGTATQYAYTTSYGRVTRTVVTDARGVATTYAIGAAGDVAQVTLPIGGGSAQITYAYDARHNVTQVTDPRGHRTTYEYTTRNGGLHQGRRLSAGHPAAVSDVPGRLGAALRAHQRERRGSGPAAVDRSP